jgi:tetratricopeptide (TPR) repeat protein
MIEKVFGWRRPGVDYDSKVIDLADRSIAIDPESPQAYSSKSVYLTNGNHPVEGLRAAEAGLAVNPNDALLHAARALAENYLGHFEDGVSEAERAMRLSPRDPNIGTWFNFKSEAEVGLGRYDAAIEDSNKAIEAGYRVFLAYVLLSVSYALKGDLEQAKTALAEARRLNPKLTVEYMRQRYPDFPWMVEGLRKAGLPEQ